MLTYAPEKIKKEACVLIFIYSVTGIFANGLSVVCCNELILLVAMGPWRWW